MSDKKSESPKDDVTTSDPEVNAKEDDVRSQTTSKSKKAKRKATLESDPNPVTTGQGDPLASASSKKIKKKELSADQLAQLADAEDTWYLQMEESGLTHPIRASEILKKESLLLQELQKKASQSISSSTMQTVITGITAMDAKGYNLKAEDWRKHKQEVLRATSSLADDQAISQRNQSIPDTNWLQVELALTSG
jgi:hypothetical protein